MLIFILFLLTVLASSISTLTGFGLSTIMIPLMVFWFPMGETLIFVGILHWFEDLWKLILFRSGINWRIVLLFTIPGIIATLLGAQIVVAAEHQHYFLRFFGLFLVAYSLFLLFRPKVSLAPTATTLTTFGGLSGLSAGLFGMGGAIRSMALTVFNLPKEVYIATSGLAAIGIDTARLSSYLIQGISFEHALFVALIACIPASFIGANVAKKIVPLISQELFRKMIVVFLLGVGVKLVVWPG